ncbi:nucleotidyltransferase substrate binding protein [Chryseobacterium salipaludis]|uniref:nucleotidyltransferase substrate binding protein n=1 Tax=Chryseobacterium TaxID=59732 RepID=UPI001FF1344F|nr:MULTISPECIES: nucleotidyltransferase substrate binding protein [Chryseobacterium]MCJ8498346.1 nucleotidyltransferase substrate binding protein [Chryseobacterium salipaludis]MCX3297408.1 nucleotidyltransferase substrate binding protein [Planobacterium sp. JC490]
MKDIRWEQRFGNYRKALKRLLNNIAFVVSGEDTEWEDDEDIVLDILLATPDIIKQGLIQSFEFTHELAWKVMKDYAEFQGNTEIKGSRDAVLYAAQVALISKAHVWMEMMKSRNSTSHTYNEDTANEITKYILFQYKEEFVKFEYKMESLRSGEQGNLFE